MLITMVVRKMINGDARKMMIGLAEQQKKQICVREACANASMDQSTQGAAGRTCDDGEEPLRQHDGGEKHYVDYHTA
jgi:hypothetical protein